MANLDDAFVIENGILFSETDTAVFSGAIDPIGVGVPAPIGSFYLRTDGSSYTKIGPLNTDWSQLAFIDSFVPTVAGADTHVQFNEGGDFGANPNFTFNYNTSLASIIGTGTNLAIGTNASLPNAKVFIETDNLTQQGLHIFFNDGLNSGYLIADYEEGQAHPRLRLIDEDNDIPEIQFQTIGTGTLASPQLTSSIGLRGTIGAATTGFRFLSQNSEIMTLDSHWIKIPVGTTTQRPTLDNGMLRYNTTLAKFEFAEGGNWVQYSTTSHGHVTLPTQNEKDAMTFSSNPSSGNPFLTLADLTGGLPTGQIPNNFNNYDSDSEPFQDTASSFFEDLVSLDVNVTSSSTVPIFVTFSYTVNRIGGFSDTVAAFRVVRTTGPNTPEESLGMQAWMDIPGAVANGTVTFRTQALPPGTYTFRPQFRRVSGSGVVRLVRGQIFAQAQQGALPTEVDWNIVSNTPTTLSGYGITDAIPLAQKGSNDGVATLDSTGKIPSAQLPATAISNTFVVASQSAQTALAAQIGDVAVRTDISRSYILRSEPATNFSNWQELLTPVDAVQSVNGQTGAVNITNITGNSATATALETTRTISASGDASAVAQNFNGTQNVTLPLVLSTVNTSPQSNSFRKITVNAKGLVTATSAVTNSDITTALGFNPYNATNPAGYTTNTGTVTSVNIAGPASGISISGSPITTSGTITLSLGDDLAAVESITGTGIVRRTATNTWAAGGQINLASEVTGQLLVANGGTGGNSPLSARTNIGAAASGGVGVSGITMATSRLLGRTAASTGPIEEIIVGAGLSLSAGVLSSTSSPAAVTSVSAVAPAAGLTISGSPITSSGTFTFDIADDLLALENLSGTGIAVRTGTSAWTQRSIAGTSGRINVSNGNGVSGNPTIDLAAGVITPGTFASVTVDTYGRVVSGSTVQSIATGGTGLSSLGSAGQILTVNSTGTGLEFITLPNLGPSAPVNSIQYNGSGSFAGSSNNTWDNVNNINTINGATNTNRLTLLAGAGPTITAERANAVLYIQSEGDSTYDAFRTFFRRSSNGISGWVSFNYDQNTPNIRLTDEDDDSPYVAFNTIGTGSYNNPLYTSVFGAKGQLGSRTGGNNQGFSWLIGSNVTPESRFNSANYNSSVIAELDDIGFSLRRPAPNQVTGNPTGIRIFARERASRTMAAAIGPSGLDYTFQALLAAQKIGWWTAQGNSTSVSTINFGNSQNGQTSRSVSTSSFAQSLRRIGYVTSSSSGSSAGTRHNILQFWRGNTPSAGGFTYIARFSMAASPSNVRWFVGMVGQSGQLGNSNPTSVSNILGFGIDSGQTTVRFIHNSGSGTATAINMGSEFSATDIDEVYEIRIFCPPNASFIGASIENLQTGQIVDDIVVTSNIPSSTQLLSPQIWINNGSSSSSAAIDVISQYIETDI